MATSSTPPQTTWPIYVPSKNRATLQLTTRLLDRAKQPYTVVVEQAQEASYRAVYDPNPYASIMVLPWDDQGLVAARNAIRDHSTEQGDERHWQLDDNILNCFRRIRGKRAYCDLGLALRAVETFVDRYENIAIAGMDYDMFVPNNATRPPFVLNTKVYSNTLFLNSVPYRWRLTYNDDTDICLQVLSGGWCTVAFNAFLIGKETTMKHRGGNTDDLYQGDGRLKMARSLERVWPHLVTTKRRFQRPQHVVRNAWRDFTTPLRLKPGIDLTTLPKVDELGQVLAQKKADVSSPVIHELLDSFGAQSPHEKDQSP